MWAEPDESTRDLGAIGVFNSVDHMLPRNSGSARAVNVLLRENCCAGIPVHPASCSMATSGIAERIAGAVQRALSAFADGLGMASTGPECPLPWLAFPGSIRGMGTLRSST